MNDNETQVYTAALQNGRTVGYYFNTLPPREGGQDYMTVYAPIGDLTSRSWLWEGMYRLVEREIALEIPLRKFSPAMSGGGRLQVCEAENWQPEEVFSVASESFETDSRFVLDQEHWSAELKNELLYRYICELKEQNARATYLYREGSLEGYNLWMQEGDRGRIYLGGMSAKYKGTGIALTLYSHTAALMKENGLAALWDTVASSNTASLNLHAMLARSAGGAFRFARCVDIYQKVKTAGTAICVE